MIFYLSGTGNTEWAAQYLAQKTGEQLVFIPDWLRANEARGGETADQQTEGQQTALQSDAAVEPSQMLQLKEGERIGLCFPVHGWRPPQIVRRFIELMPLPPKGHYLYAVCTAGDNIGETIDILRQDLGKRGLQLDAAFSLIMPESYVGLPFFEVDPEAKEMEKKRKAEDKLKQFTDLILQRQQATDLVIGHWPRLNSRFLGGVFTRYLITDKPFRVDSAKCVKCGICADVCPTQNVIGGLGKEPVWKHDGSCLACFACYHHCPHHAIEYGRQTQHKGQYFYKKRRG